MRLADYYIKNCQHINAIKLYNKILRKNSVRKNLKERNFAKINFDLGYLYSQLNFINPAIESYARGSAKFAIVGIDHYYRRDDLEKDKLLAIGFLEAGRWDIAIEEFKKLKQLYPQFLEVEKYIKTAMNLKEKNSRRDDRNFYFMVGEAYIQNQLFNEAKVFFTKRILDYGFHPLEVLNYLNQAYSQNREIREKVWGDNIYVTLEDFETIEPQLSKWVGNAKSKVNSHHITTDAAYKGIHSEFLDITYTKAGFDYWTKPVDMLLTNPNLVLAVRMFIKSEELFKGCLEINISYPKQGTSGIWQADVKENTAGGWEECRIDNLSEKAKTIASRFNWNTSEMKLDRIIIDTAGVSNKFYIDEIELYLVN